MRTITDLLKNTDADVRVSVGNVWMYWDSNAEWWIVRRSHRGSGRRPTVVIETIDESIAVREFAKAANIDSGV